VVCIEELNKTEIKRLEKSLKNYSQYKAGIINLHSYFHFVSQTNLFESNQANVHPNSDYPTKNISHLMENIYKYKLIVQSIDLSIEGLCNDEKTFIELRYFKNHSIKKIGDKMGYCESTLYMLRKSILQKLSISLRFIVDLNI
jgi:DNA-directed RNA polymerase specialized sigma subunit